MDDLAGDRAGQPPPPPHLPIPPEDLLLEIFLRLLSEPIYLFRASFVCKQWRRLVHDARFLRRFREFHGGTPPVLGYFNNQREPRFFVSTTDAFAAYSPALPDNRRRRRNHWCAVDCRHGRALLENSDTWTLLVWDLVTGDQCYLPMPLTREGMWNGALVCAGDDHGDCRSRPFILVYVFSYHIDSTTRACVCSSETGRWSEVTSLVTPRTCVDVKPSALVGNTLYWLMDNWSILDFDLDNNRLGLSEEFPYDALCSYEGQVVLMPTEDGRLGLAGVEGFFNLHLWSMAPTTDGLVTWTRQRVIDLENFLAPEVVATRTYAVEAIGFAEDAGVEAIGFAEDAGVIFIVVHRTIYMIHLKSMQIREVSEKGIHGSIFPYTSFYAPGITIGGGDDQTEVLNNS